MQDLATEPVSTLENVGRNLATEFGKPLFQKAVNDIKNKL